MNEFVVCFVDQNGLLNKSKVKLWFLLNFINYNSLCVCDPADDLKVSSAVEKTPATTITTNNLFIFGLIMLLKSAEEKSSKCNWSWTRAQKANLLKSTHNWTQTHTHYVWCLQWPFISRHSMAALCYYYPYPCPVATLLRELKRSYLRSGQRRTDINGKKTVLFQPI